MSERDHPSSSRGDELKRALHAIRDLRRRLGEFEQRAHEPIAIVGMSCRLPGGVDSPESLWDLLRNGVDATCEVPRDRWDADAIYDPDPDAVGRSYVRRGGFLKEPVDRFDPGFFGISPREASGMDPMHRMLLEMAWEALERAGIPPYSLEGSRTGVFTGLSVSDYEMLQQGGDLRSIHSYRGTGTIASVAGGRISHCLGLQGPNFPVDTACSAGLVALVLAVEQLRNDRCDLALVGSTHLMLSAASMVLLCRMHALSADGRCHTFDKSASGYARGEGGGMLVLKRLSDALADADPILAVVRGVASNHDGRSSGLTVPNPVAQRRVLEAALQDAGMEANQIGYVEAHGTATQLGDPIELRALAEVLGRDRAPDRPLMLGTIKTNVGHLEPAAGIAGVMKVVLSLMHRQLPPHLNFNEPTPHVDWQRLPLRVPTSLTDWNVNDGRRAAGVSAFGFSGTNAHVILEEAPESAAREPKPERPVHLIALSGRTRRAVQELATRYRQRLADATPEQVADLAATSVIGRSHHEFRAVATGTSAAELTASLDQLQQAGEQSCAHVRGAGGGSLAFLFTGQGAQWPAMGRELWDSSATFRATLERCNAILQPHLDRPLLPLLLEESQAEALDQTVYTQPALFALEYALAELWRSWGIEPTHVLGHSLGEYVAATVAGVFELEQVLPLVALRGRLMQDLPAGGRMVAVFGTEQQVVEAMQGLDSVSIAAVNGPANVVISGAGEQVSEVLRRLEPAGLKMSDLRVSHAFHSPLMEPMLDTFEKAVREIERHAPRLALISNVSGELMTAEEAADPSRWRRHLREPVQFAVSMIKLAQSGVRHFVEIGPHPTLIALGMESVTENDAQWLPSLRRGRPAWTQLADSVGGLYRTGHDLDWAGWGREHRGRRVTGPTYPFQRERYWFTDLPNATPSARVASGMSRVSNPAGHPLLGESIRSPAIEGRVFQVALDSHTPDFLSDHRVQERVVVPGAVFMEMMLAAARQGPGWEKVKITSLTFERPLILDDAQCVDCQVLIKSDNGGPAAVKVVSSIGTAGASEWVVHATANIEAHEGTDYSGPSRESLRTTADQTVNVSGLYARIEQRGIDYGAAFRTLVHGWTGNGGAFGEGALEAESSAAAVDYCAHPCLVDGGFHLLDSLTDADADATAMFLPAGIDEARFHEPLGSACSMHVTIEPQADPDLLLADMVFFNADGQPALELLGCRARRVKDSVARMLAATDAAGGRVYELDWQPVDLPEDAPAATGTWLVLEDEHGIGNIVAAELQAHGARCIRVRHGDSWQQDGDRFTVSCLDDSNCARLLEAAGLSTAQPPLQGVVHLWSLRAPAAQNAGAAEIGSSMLGTLMPIVVMLRAGLFGTDGSIRIVTSGASGPEGASPGPWHEGAALWGLLPVLQSEHPELACRIVDIDGASGGHQFKVLGALLFGETAEDRIAVRGSQILAPRLKAEQHPAQSQSSHRALPDAEGYRIDIEKRGTLDALRYVPLPRRAPGRGEVEVSVRTTGLNFRDVLNVLDMYPGDPGQPGVEFAGLVTRVGSGVKHIAAGDEVFGLGIAAFASHVTAPAAGVIRIPERLSAEEAATIPLAFLTAEWGLAHLANLARGERVLIHAAAGGVGQAAVQLALAAGAEVFATAGNDEKRDYLRAQGVSGVFDSRNPAFADEVLKATNGEGVDVVLNALTGEMLQRSLALLRSGGRFLELGKTELLNADEVAAERPGIRYEAFDLGTILVEEPETFQSLFRDVAARFASGELQPLKARTFGAEEIVEAFRFMAQARHIGKVVIAAARIPDRQEQPLIRADASYLVTGATGGIGRALVEWLVQRQAGAVMLISRSAPGEETSRWIEDLRAGGAILHWRSADVANEQDVQRVLAEAAMDLPLAGVFHAAGTLDDGLLLDQTRERIEGVLAPKVLGAWNLHRATQHLALDHFVLFSSVASLMGGPGQAGYAAANSFLGALAERRRRCGLAATGIDWGAWAGSGMASRLTSRERALLEDSGLGFLDSTEAIDLMERILVSAAPRRVVVNINWSRLSRAARKMSPLLEMLVAKAPVPQAQSPTPSTDVPRADVLAGLEPGERKTLLMNYICQVLSSIIGVRMEQIEADQEIGRLGFDSLMAMELRNRIETEIGVLVPVSKLLGSTTPADIADELARMVETMEMLPDHVERKLDVETWMEGEI